MTSHSGTSPLAPDSLGTLGEAHISRRGMLRSGTAVAATGLVSVALPSVAMAASGAGGAGGTGGDGQTYSAIIDTANRSYGLFTFGAGAGIFYLYIPYINSTGSSLVLGDVTAASDLAFINPGDTTVLFSKWSGEADGTYANNLPAYVTGPNVGTIAVNGLFVARVSVLDWPDRVYSGNYMRLTQSGGAVTFEPVNFSDSWWLD